MMRNMQNSVVHIMVIWHSAMKFKDKILDDLNESFQVLKVFRGHWEKKYWLENWQVFYAHSQYHRHYIDFRQILIGKMRECQKGDFEVIVFNDFNPVFEERKTSSGVRLVNTRAFDKKQMYRQWTGGGSKIHGSDDAWETNKDLTLMFGMNTEDFCKYYAKDFSGLNMTGNCWTEDSFCNNCIGVNGYKDIQQFFYVLNNTIRYCVLRNHEPIPVQYTVDGHGDIDLLVENKDYIAYLTLAKPLFVQKYRAYHFIKIGDAEVPMDFRVIGDGYYDEPWEQNVLKTRVFTKNLFYVPNAENQFYTLLYHAYVQKKEVKQDYLPKLEKYGSDIGIAFKKDKERAFEILDAFMTQHKYEYTIPNDKSVLFNYENLKHSKHIKINGFCYRRNKSIDMNFSDFESVVCKRNDKFVKKGTKWLIDNEVACLNKLKDSRYFPKVLNHTDLDESFSMFEMTSMQGVSAEHFFSHRRNCKRIYVFDFINEVFDILSILHQKQTLHRDIKLDNFIIDFSHGVMNVSLIDFGWSCDYNHFNSPTPQICPLYSTKENKLDPFEFGNLLLAKWGCVPTCRKIAKKLIEVKTVKDINLSFYDNLKKYLLQVSFVDTLAIHTSFIVFYIKELVTNAPNKFSCVKKFLDVFLRGKFICNAVRGKINRTFRFA